MKSFFFFFNDTATTEIYTLSLHDALPILKLESASPPMRMATSMPSSTMSSTRRSEEHTSELQSPCNLVCRLLLEKKKKIQVAHARLSFEVSWLHFVSLLRRQSPAPGSAPT